MRGEGKFYLTDETGRRIFGPGPAELLEQVEPLVSTEAGGLGGGGSTITPQAKALLAWFRQARQAVQEAAQAQLDRLPQDGQ